MSQLRIGIWALLVGLSGKIFGIVIKLAKSAKVVKVGLAGASVAGYSLLYTWQFAIAIVVAIGWHEFGHLVQMKREGMKVKGFYFIPFLGGVAIADGDWPSHAAEVRIALAGPFFGFLMAATSAILYVLTMNSMFAIVASFTAMINLFNMLPVFPLDGGRVFRASAMSINSSLGTFYLLTVAILVMVLAVTINVGLFLFIGLIGIIEVLPPLFAAKRRSKELVLIRETIEYMEKIELVTVTEIEVENFMSRFPTGTPLVTMHIEALRQAAMAEFLKLERHFSSSLQNRDRSESITQEIGTQTSEDNLPSIYYPAVFEESKNYQEIAAALGIKILRGELAKYENAEPSKPGMKAFDFVYAISLFLALFLGFVCIMAMMSGIPGADIASQILK